MPEPSADLALRPRAILVGTLTAFHDPSAAPDPDVEYRVTVDGESFDVRASDGRFRSSRAGTNIAASLRATGRTLLALRRGECSFADAVASGQLELSGADRSIASFRSVFSLG